jgi:hypothetical protein
MALDSYQVTYPGHAKRPLPDVGAPMQSKNFFSGTRTLFVATLGTIIPLLLSVLPACGDAPKHCCNLEEVVSQVQSADHAVAVVGVVEQVSSANVILDGHTTPTHYSLVAVQAKPEFSPTRQSMKLTFLSLRALEVSDFLSKQETGVPGNLYASLYSISSRYPNC